jgi:hypothetical protein
MASSVDNSAWLNWMTTLMTGVSKGGGSRQTYAATLPPDRYYCLLDELPLHLIPRRTLRSLYARNEQTQPLFLNPECAFCSDGRLPDELSDQGELFSRFAMQGTIAWVRNPATSALLPFWLGPQLEAVVRSLRTDEPTPTALPGDTIALLTAAGILLPEAQGGKRVEDDLVMRAGSLLREKGYAPLNNLIHPFHIAALRRYYRYLIRTGAVQLGDRQSARRYVAYKEPVARFFHQYIAAAVSAVAGEPVKPSYVYLASYLGGAELKKHTDREQCEFSVTLCLDFSPEPVLETQWPISLDTTDGTVTVYQALGDGLAYRGTRLPHYRDALGEGQTSTSIFFHYVAADFAGSLD